MLPKHYIKSPNGLLTPQPSYCKSRLLSVQSLPNEAVEDSHDGEGSKALEDEQTRPTNAMKYL